MIKHEQILHAKVMRWLQYNYMHIPAISFLIETKVVRPDSNRFPFSELSEKERRLLKQAKHRRIIQTHSDFGGLGTNCDGSVVAGGGYIFLHWVRRGNNIFYVIDIDTLQGYIDDNPKIKSLDETTARTLAVVVGELK